MYRLYHFPLSPFCRKVRLVMAEKSIEVDLRAEPYWQKRADFLRLNPSSKVPVLQDHQMVLSESNAICEYLEELYPSPALLPHGPEERAEVRRLINWFDDTFYHSVTHNLLNERLLKKVTGRGMPESRNIREGMKNIKTTLDYLNWLLDRRRWLGGHMLSLADFSAAAQLSCLDYISDVDWDRSALVKNWYATLKSRPAFRTLLVDHIDGFPPPPHYANLDF
ncbi:MAG: glutathione S-transferase family protein [Candidatus Halichondribacter symbioticus]